MPKCAGDITHHDCLTADREHVCTEVVVRHGPASASAVSSQGISTQRTMMQLQCWLAVLLDEGEQEGFGHKQAHDDLREAATAEEAKETNEGDLLEELVDFP